MTTPSIEARVAHVEGIIEEIRARLLSMENRLDRMEDRMASLEARMSYADTIPMDAGNNALDVGDGYPRNPAQDLDRIQRFIP
jgi:uncharacterized coiled-coil protein SlyX